MPYEAQDAMESPSELHGLRRRMVDGGLVDAAPWPGPGVVAEQAGLAVPLVLDGSGGEHEVREVANLLVGQDCPESVLDELGHFFSEEGGLLGSGGVASSADALVFLFESPRLGGGLNRDTVVSPLREHRSGRVVEVF